jgi:hypothetical protein
LSGVLGVEVARLLLLISDKWLWPFIKLHIPLRLRRSHLYHMPRITLLINYLTLVSWHRLHHELLWRVQTHGHLFKSSCMDPILHLIIQHCLLYLHLKVLLLFQHLLVLLPKRIRIHL